MRSHMKTALGICAVAWSGFHASLLGYTGAEPAQFVPAAQQSAGTAGRSTGKSIEKPREKAARTPEPTPVGTPFGDTATTVIGPAGGTVKSADGAITLEIPPGAVSKEATFSIQAITNDAPGRIGDAFRITPHGTTFKVPAKITFQYTDDDVLGSSPGLLRVAYQDKSGYWRAPKAVMVDEKAKTVSVVTTHLSDWSAFTGAQLLPHSATVRVGQTVALKLMTCEWVDTPTASTWDELQPEERRASCTDTYANGNNGPFVDRWSVNSIAGGNATVGTVAPTDVLEHAAYVAPANARKAISVMASVDYRSSRSAQPQQLISRITVVDPKTDCQELRNTEVLKGGMTFTYEFSGTGPQGEQYVVRQGAHLAATLKRVRKDASTWVWRGPAQADGALNDSLTMNGVTQRVTGNGGFIDSTSMVVTVRVKDCTYTAAAEVAVQSITTMEVAGQTFPTKGNTLVGSARTGMRPVKGGMWGSGDFALSPGDRETEGDYHSGGFGKTLTAAFKPGELGTATVTWTIAPPRPDLAN
jgi:hypothetical protein